VIGVIRDRVFSFYYPENLEALQEAGARLVFIDALRDVRLPDIGALYIGGGFPEMFMDELAANEGLRWDVRQAVQSGLPVYAECGGLMYLSRSIRWKDGVNADAVAPMAGALPCDVEMTARPQGHGYVLARCQAPNPFFTPGAILRGHEFHNSRLTGLPGDFPTAFRLERGNGVGAGRDGLVYRKTLAGYTHLHAYGAPEWAVGLVARSSGSAGR
jgi:cobyrinic acid a,c-diamide synthase